ncbi:MAG: VIT1/CCC1 transporter family protein [bacterium]|nr:VIT1/CCC1 transporter family protein [bacterium]
MPRHKNIPFYDYIHSSVFGIEDSLVSTTGLIAGVAVASGDKNFVIMAGLIAIVVESASMAAGEFISEETEVDLSFGKRQTNPILSGLIMFISYFLAGFVPLLPIILFVLPLSLYFSIIAAAIGLFILGAIKGKLTRKSLVKSGIKVLIVGGIAAILGITVGIIFKV